jgi:alpha-glucosidase
MNLKKIGFVLHALGLGVTSRTVRYALMREKIEKQYTIDSPTIEHVLPGKHIQTDQIQSGFKVEYENAKVEVICLTSDLVRVSWEPGKSPIPYAIAKNDWQEVNTTVEETASGCVLSTGDLTSSVNTDGRIIFQDKFGNVLREDLPPSRQGDLWKLTSNLKPDENIYGLGERAASINLRPGRYRMWNTDPDGSYSTGKDPLYICTPVYIGLSNAGSYLVFFENSYPSTFTFGRNAEVEFEGGMLRYYFIVGSFTNLLTRYSELVGRPDLPPRWVFGYHHSRWGYRSEDDIRNVIKGFKDHALPISAIHLDIDYMDGFRLFTINEENFPDMRKLTSDLRNEEIKVVSILDVGVKRDPKYSIYQEGIRKGVFCKLPDGKILNGLVWPGWSVYPDFTKPETRQWWAEKYQQLLDAGIAGFWHDMNEPTSFAAWGEKTLPRPTVHNMEGRGGDHREAHNLYGLLMNRSGYEALRKYTPDRRPWIFSRSGWAGLQRYAWNWTGDTETSWQSLRQTIATILGLGLSGHAFSGPDIGGFSGSPSAELYLRWFQLATFLPFFRTHSAIGTERREPWVYGEPTTSIIRKYLKIRYRLLPYLYTLAWDAHVNGVPPVRPLFWIDPGEQSLRNIDDAFLLGDALLIAPMLVEGAHTRQVILPPGNWYSYWDDHISTGSTRLEVDAADDIIPIFVKEGSIVPMEDNQFLQLHIYPQLSGDSSSHIYLDEGDGYGEWRIDKFELTRHQNDLIITWDTEGNYSFPYKKILIQIHGLTTHKVWVDGIEAQLHDNLIESTIFQKLRIKVN